MEFNSYHRTYYCISRPFDVFVSKLKDAKIPSTSLLFRAYIHFHLSSSLFLVPSRTVNFVAANALSSTSIKVRWGRIPQEQIHGILRGYKILFRVLGNNDSDYMVNETIPFTYEIVLEKLLKFTKYGIRVIGYTSIGDGKASDEISCTTLEDCEYRQFSP